MKPIKLFVDSNYASPYAMSVYVTLLEKGLAFDVETVNLGAGDHLQPPYRDQSLTAKVPSLAHGEFALSESSAIVEYLEEVFPSPEYPTVLPKDVAQRARARQIQAWLRSDLTAIRAERPTEVLFFGKRYPALSDAAKMETTKLIRVAETLLSHGNPNLFGDWSIADMELALMLNRLVLNGDEMPAQLVEYAGAQWQHPSVRKWVEVERGG